MFGSVSQGKISDYCSSCYVSITRNTFVSSYVFHAVFSVENHMARLRLQVDIVRKPFIALKWIRGIATLALIAVYGRSYIAGNNTYEFSYLRTLGKFKDDFFNSISSSLVCVLKLASF